MGEALRGVKIVDLTRDPPGNYCTMILGDLGADITMIEEPGPPSGRRREQMKGCGPPPQMKEFASNDSAFNPLRRNKRSMRLNLKMDAGRHIFYQLVEKADVVVEGFRPGTAARLGIDYLTLDRMNPGLIYCAITSYGQDGPYSHMPGHDINFVSQAGAASIMRHPEAPPPIPGNIIGDMAAGGMQAAIGILAALMARVQTGKGQFVDIAMTDGIVSLGSLYLGGYFQYGEVPREEERSSIGTMPFNSFYETKDGKFISVSCREPWFYANLCRVLGCKDFIPYQSDAGKAGEIKSYFKQKFLSRDRDEWFEVLSQADIPVGKVYALDELTSDPQLNSRKMFMEIDHPVEGKVCQPGIAIKLSDTPGTIRNLAPPPGGNTDEVLSELGYSEEHISKLKKDGVARALGD
jgi:crotonobetainyl-CoA:carnitine CoA-transferase CaiB-like acyl-CoA transferase